MPGHSPVSWEPRVERTSGAGANAPAPDGAPLLVVTGSIHYDYLLRLPRLPQANDRISVQAQTLAPGGMGGNVAAIFGRLGGRVRFAGLFSDDEDGRSLRADLEADGADCRWSAWRDGPGWRGFILTGEGGERAIIGGWPPRTPIARASGQAPGGASPIPTFAWQRHFDQFRTLFAAPELFDGADGVACPSSHARYLLPFMPEHLPLFIDIETGHLDDTGEAEIWSLLRRAEIAYGNERNLRQLAARLDCRDVTELAARAGCLIVMTCGQHGCIVYHGQTPSHTPGFQVESVDTTGAGDCFAAAFSLGYLREWSPSETATLANAAAALSTTALGSRPGVKGLRETMAFIDQMTVRSGAVSECAEPREWSGDASSNE